MVDRENLIRILDNLLQALFKKERFLLDEINLKQNDTRVTFYKHMMNTIDSTIHLIIFTHRYLPEGHWWTSTHNEYKLSKRLFANGLEENYIQEFKYIDEHIAFSYYHAIFHSFEASIRFLSLNYLSNYYLKGKRGEKIPPGFRNLFESFLSKVDLWNEENKNFIEIVVKFRNSIHINGIYHSPTETSHSLYSENPSYHWKNKDYSFIHGKQIRAYPKIISL